MRFGCYKRLTAKQKATYRRSDEVTAVAVPDVAALVPLVEQVDAAQTSGKRLATAKAATTFALAFCRQLGVPPVLVTVRLVRPEIRGGDPARLSAPTTSLSPPADIETTSRACTRPGSRAASVTFIAEAA